MDRLGAVASYILITVVLMLGLRGAHLLIGVAYPASLPGPFELASLDDVERHTGFHPHVPFYRPMVLGQGPLEIVAERRPVPMARVFWSDESSLELTEWAGAYRPPAPETAVPMPNHRQAVYWRSGDELIALLPVADRWLRIRTDLDLSELERIVETLLPYDRLL